MHVIFFLKNVFVENVWPANLALFVYVSIHCVETVKWLDYNRYSQLTRCNLLTAITSRVATLISVSSKDHVTIEYHVMCLVFCMLYSVQYGEILIS